VRCIECSEDKPADAFTVNPSGLCFRCKLNSFGGVTYRGIHMWGRKSFAAHSRVAFERELHEGAKANGIEYDRAEHPG
jgi:hypothetical protein